MSPLTQLWASALKSTVGLRLRLERRPLGLEGPGRPSPQAFRPSAQLLRGRLVWGPPPPQSPGSCGGVGGGAGRGVRGSARLPLPGQLLQNHPALTFHPLLKGKSLLPNSACPKPSSWGKKTPSAGEDEHQETLPGPPVQALRPFPRSPPWPPSGGKRPQFCKGICTWASGDSSSGVRRPAP